MVGWRSGGNVGLICDQNALLLHYFQLLCFVSSKIVDDQIIKCVMVTDGPAKVLLK